MAGFRGLRFKTAQFGTGRRVTSLWGRARFSSWAGMGGPWNPVSSALQAGSARRAKALPTARFLTGLSCSAVRPGFLQPMTSKWDGGWRHIGCRYRDQTYTRAFSAGFQRRWERSRGHQTPLRLLVVCAFPALPNSFGHREFEGLRRPSRRDGNCPSRRRRCE